MASCKAAGVPVVVSPIWISLARALWGSRGSTAVLTQAVEQGEVIGEPLLRTTAQAGDGSSAAARPS